MGGRKSYKELNAVCKFFRFSSSFNWYNKMLYYHHPCCCVVVMLIGYEMK